MASSSSSLSSSKCCVRRRSFTCLAVPLCAGAAALQFLPTSRRHTATLRSPERRGESRLWLFARVSICPQISPKCIPPPSFFVVNRGECSACNGYRCGAAASFHPSIGSLFHSKRREREREREREPQMPRPTLFRPDVNEQASERGRTYLLARVCVSWMDTRRNDGGGCAPIKHLPPLQALQPS